ncbi:MAG: hypothetical protein MMC23_001190 [Stictis urceolatum]|nr:hypothetical protein [Stictis urceolata]
MKFLYALFTGAAVASSVGSPVAKRASLVERDAAAVSSAISQISDATTKLDTAVKDFTGAGQVSSLQSASTNLIKVLGSANSAVSSSSMLSQSDALSLPQPIQDLSKLVQTAAQDTISKKQTFVSAGVASVVYDQLTEIRDGAKKFSTTLISKVPNSLQNIAQNLAQPINDSLNKAVSAYSDVKDSSGSSSIASGSASASATGSTPASASASAPASSEVASGSAYATSAAGTAPGAVSPSSNGTGSYTTGSTPAIATGAAVPAAAAGYGVVAAAALAVVAVF